MNWKMIATNPPPRNVVVMTKIDDTRGPRNEQPLKLHATGNLWFVPDGSTYVYYTPTHWKEMT